MARTFDIRRSLATKAPYAHRIVIPNAPRLADVPDPPGYAPIHLFLLARHGSRWPTRQRVKQILELEPVLAGAVRAPEAAQWTAALRRTPYAAGDLHPLGEEELLGLGERLRARFPSLLRPQYFTKRFPLISTQVPRASQSASAFALSFFNRTCRRATARSRQGSAADAQQPCAERRLPAPAQPTQSDPAACEPQLQPVALSMAPKRQDPLLRFFDMCPAYEQREDAVARLLAPWEEAQWAAVSPRVTERLGLSQPLQPRQVDALWQLCTFQGGLLENVDGGACGAFDASDAAVMEDVEDVRLWHQHSYGHPLNFRIAAPLMADLARSLLDAGGSKGPAPLQRARLLFAHCETLVPFASLLGLFQPSPDEAATLDSPLRAAAAAADAEAGLKLPPMGEVEEDLWSLDSSDDLELTLAAKGRVPSAGGAAAGAPSARRYQQQQRQQQQQQEGAVLAAAATAERVFRGGRVSPLGANLAVILYRECDGAEECTTAVAETARTADTDEADKMEAVEGFEEDAANAFEGWAGPSTNAELVAGAAAKWRRLRARRHLVRLVYNEQVVPVPGCSREAAGLLDCDLEEFLELVRTRADAAVLEELCAAGDDEPAVREARAGQGDRGAASGWLTGDGLPLHLPAAWWGAKDADGGGGSLPQAVAAAA